MKLGWYSIIMIRIFNIIWIYWAITFFFFFFMNFIMDFIMYYINIRIIYYYVVFVLFVNIFIMVDVVATSYDFLSISSRTFWICSESWFITSVSIVFTLFFWAAIVVLERMIVKMIVIVRIKITFIDNMLIQNFLLIFIVDFCICRGLFPSAP